MIHTVNSIQIQTFHSNLDSNQNYWAKRVCLLSLRELQTVLADQSPFLTSEDLAILYNDLSNRCIPLTESLWEKGTSLSLVEEAQHDLLAQVTNIQKYRAAVEAALEQRITSASLLPLHEVKQLISQARAQTIGALSVTNTHLVVGKTTRGTLVIGKQSRTLQKGNQTTICKFINYTENRKNNYVLKSTSFTVYNPYIKEDYILKKLHSPTPSNYIVPPLVGHISGSCAALQDRAVCDLRDAVSLPRKPSIEQVFTTLVEASKRETAHQIYNLDKKLNNGGSCKTKPKKLFKTFSLRCSRRNFPCAA